MVLRSCKNPDLLHYSQPISKVLCYFHPSSNAQSPQIILQASDPRASSPSFAIRLLIEHPLCHSFHMIYPSYPDSFYQYHNIYSSYISRTCYEWIC
ncbi:unnamed protein product [Nezara viridula]|uniref:Uncharacterized protein n=1 Tax=Nezara viridula TaxID=85310 RepID=A0A9P0MI14_NEZVI|nr:unnamed protein product [Nezara viridula]